MSAAALRPVLFDLDGTLLDTAPDMIAALNALRLEQRLTELPFDAMRRHVSHGSLRLIEVGFPGADAEQFERLRLRFLDIYSTRLTAETRPFPGFEPVLAELDARGVPWGVVTNKPAFLTGPLLEGLGLAARAGAVVSGDTLPERKPHPAPLLHAARTIGRAPAEFVYVGDAERDIAAARAAGMRSLIARFGYLGPDDTPERWQADGIIDSPYELLGWLATTTPGGRA